MSARTILAILSIFSLFASYALPFARKTHAQFVVTDPVNLVENAITSASSTSISLNSYKDILKEFSLDQIATTIARNVIKDMTAQVIGWVNTGFDGQPFFVQNTESFLGDIADKEVLQFFNEIQGSEDPFKRDLSKALIQEYTGSYAEQGKFNLDQIIGPNWENFEDDFTVGGWNGYIAATQAPQNNPIGSYLRKADELSRRIKSEKEVAKQELAQNDGFVSQQNCVEEGGELTDEGDRYCLREETLTPGGVIKTQLTDTLGSTLRQLEVSDDFGEIVSNALVTLIGDLVQDQGQGLLGLTSRGSSSQNVFDRKLAELRTGTTSATQTRTSSRGSSWLDQNDLIIDLDQELKTAIANTEKEAKLYADAAKKLKTFPAKLYHLDRCLPGPDLGWEKRLREEVRDEESNLKLVIKMLDLIPLFGDKLRDDAEDALDSVHEKLENLIEDMRTVMLTENIPSAPLSFDYIDRVQEFNSKARQYDEKATQKTRVAARLKAIQSSSYTDEEKEIPQHAG